MATLHKGDNDDDDDNNNNNNNNNKYSKESNHGYKRRFAAKLRNVSSPSK